MATNQIVGVCHLYLQRHKKLSSYNHSYINFFSFPFAISVAWFVPFGIGHFHMKDKPFLVFVDTFLRNCIFSIFGNVNLLFRNGCWDIHFASPRLFPLSLCILHTILLLILISLTRSLPWLRCFHIPFSSFFSFLSLRPFVYCLPPTLVPFHHLFSIPFSFFCLICLTFILLTPLSLSLQTLSLR